ncbi:MAG TPA: DUF1697 domain-containing protein [Steroidobacteraceae bacterium]|nr:DUF1697 domain-containing protein [Steroidobacteraceae bacterium]
MPRYVALLRAVNVGGTGKLLMSDLEALCLQAGFGQVATYIASGNVVFHSALRAPEVQARLQERLQRHAGRRIGVLLRTAAQMRAVLAANPFPERAANLTYTLFLPQKPAADILASARNRTDEEIRLGLREVYIHYPKGAGQSRLQLPCMREGTARNMNTVARLVAMSG